jgi:hypothetical protein
MMSYEISKLIIPNLTEDIGSQTGPILGSKLLVVLGQKMGKKHLPSSKDKRRLGPVCTSTKQIVGYTTVKGIQQEISLPPLNWPEFSIKELMSNAHDFLRVYYPTQKGYTAENRKIAFRVRIDPILEVIATIAPITQFAPATVITHILRIAVLNSNINNIVDPAFENLEAIFDYNNFCSTKRNQFRETSGALGDFLKRVLGMGYALWTDDFNPENSFEDKQWSEPVIFRFNNQEQKVYAVVDPGRKIEPRFSEPVAYDTPGFTEVEIALPIPASWNGHFSVLIVNLRKYCRVARIAKIQTDISFTFENEEAI